MTKIAEWILLAHGWRRLLVLVLAGALAGLAAPPFYLLPALFVGLPILVWSLDGAERGKGLRRVFGPAFSIGFCFGLGYFLVALHWIGAAFFVEGGLLLVLMPVAVLVLAAVLSIYWGLAAAAAHLFWRDGPMRIIALSVAFGAAEFARGHLLSGFPFDLLGYALTANDQMAQLASVVGVYGLSVLAVLFAATPALIWPADRRSLGSRLAPFFLVILAISAQVGWGQYRLNETVLSEVAGPPLRLVQPDIAQSVKWEAENRTFVMDRLFGLSTAKTGPEDHGVDGKAAIVWPESAMPFFLSDQPEELAQIARMLPEGGFLLTGAPRRESGDAPGDVAYNSLLAIDTAGEVISSYDKTHLVPIGEYLPFGEYLRGFGLSQFVPGANGWTAGDARRLINVPGLPGFLPLICYEALFSGEMGSAVDEAGVLLNVTNDGWFDGSVGAAQHFDHAKLRAVEEGKTLVRVANSGITALVDPLGRTVAQLSPHEPAVLDVHLFEPLPTTIFARFRHWPLLIYELAGAALVVMAALRRRRARY